MHGRRLVIAVLAIVLGASSTLGAAGDKPPLGGALLAPQAAVTATGNARILALIAPGGVLLRKKGVGSISHPSTGIYCLKPSSSKINVDTLVPSATVDYSRTPYTDSIVQIRSTRVFCPTKTLEFVTLDRLTGQNYVTSNDVQFAVVVP